MLVIFLKLTKNEFIWLVKSNPYNNYIFINEFTQFHNNHKGLGENQ